MGAERAGRGEKDKANPADEVVTYSEPNSGVYKKLIVREGRLVGAILLGDGPSTPRLLQHFDRSDRLPENRAELLFSLTGDSKEPNVADMPDDAQICNCNGVSKGKIMAAVREGKRSLTVLSNTTRAGTCWCSWTPMVQ